MSQTEARDREFIDQLHAQAEESLRDGDVRGARQIWEAILQLQPDDPKARAALESASGPDAHRAAEALANTTASPNEIASHDMAAATGEPELDLDLDLAMATGPVTDDGPGTSIPVEFVDPVQKTGGRVTTLEIDPDISEAGHGDGGGHDADTAIPLVQAAHGLGAPTAPKTDTAEPQRAVSSGETTLLVSRARQSLAAGKFDEAIDFASRALAIDDGLVSATRVLEGARAEMRRQAGELESTLSEAISDIEAGRPAAAVPLLEQVLDIIPGHAEAEQYLERAKEEIARAKDAELNMGEDIDVLSAIPLVDVPRTPRSSLSGDAARPETAEDAPEPQLAPPPPAPPPPPTSLTGVTGEPLPPPPALSGSLPPVDDEWDQVPATAPPAATQPAKAGQPKRLPAAVLVVLIVGVLGSASWLVLRGRGAGADSEPEDVARGARVEAPATENSAEAAAPATEAPGNAAQAEGRAAASGGTAPEDAGGDAPPTSRRAERYTLADVPRLVARADQLLAAGRAAQAVDLLQEAQLADPGNVELIDKIDRARSALAVRREAEQRIQAGRDAFAQGQYEEALRVFYRVPDEFRPANLDRWIANGWYNLGVRALKTGNVVEAIRFFSDGLELSPGDPDAVKHREVARRYRGRSIDDAYRIYVGNIEMRSVDSR